MLNIALIGNPNSGKTTVFNALTGAKEYVGNRAGVTVEEKKGKLKGDPNVIVTDLPGIYSLSPYTKEEIITERYLNENRPDVIINVADASSPERSLYLTLQLAEKGIPMVLMLNMTDFAEKNGIFIDEEALSALLNIKTVKASAAKGKGLTETLEAARKASKETFSPYMEYRNGKTYGSVSQTSEEKQIKERYDYIEELIKICVTKTKNGIGFTEKADRFLCGKYTAFPCFFAIMTLVYFLSAGPAGSFFSSALTDFTVGYLGEAAREFMISVNAAPWVMSLVCDGIVGGAGTVIGFLPQLTLLFFMLALLEDLGYMARVAFIMDRLFRFFGLSGKSVIPMIIATGCGVPAVMSSRTVDDSAKRRMTIITSTFMPCGAKLPVISMISTLFFDGKWWTAPLCYGIGVSAVLVSGLILKNTRLFADEGAPFIMELPEYRLPLIKNIAKTVFDRSFSFVKRAGSVILIASLAIWFFSGYKITSFGISPVSDMSESILGVLGAGISVLFRPLGFGDWRAAVATLMGLLAKEEIVGVFGVVGGAENVFSGSAEAFSFLIFNLLCTPCMAASAAIGKEMNSFKWTAFALLYQSCFAYAASFLIYRIGLLIVK